jgi:DNA-binding transcriptional MerR regulator
MTMNPFDSSFETMAVQVFEPDARTLYTIDSAAALAHISRRHVALYCKHGLVSPVVDPATGGWCFDDEGIRVLRRIEYLRSACGINFHGIKLIMRLAREVETLYEQLRFFHQT